VFFTALNKAAGIKDRISIVKPETILKWQRILIKHFWTFRTSWRKRGRRPVSREIQDLILGMKNSNNLWGVKRIQGELMKVDIVLDSKTIWNILQKFRRQGRIKAGLTWKRFLQMQAASIVAMDFFTVDTLFNRRYYVLFIISHWSREIVRLAITENPVREFVRQQLIEVEQSMKMAGYMLHDNATQFRLNYADYGLQGIAISVGAPDMNAIAERFVDSVRREALDHFLIINMNQLKVILTEYIEYYNTMRPHQGLAQHVPQNYSPHKEGEIHKQPVLSGLHHHYFRRAA
jgi:putative transposase